MALIITKTTPFNIDAVHWVLSEFYVNRRDDRLFIKFEGFEESSDWNANAKSLMKWSASYALSAIPSSLLTLLGDVKDEIEILLPTVEDFWTGATVLNDDGTPVV